MDPRADPGAGPARAGRLLLLRHPATDWNVENRWQGHADPPLSARGMEELRAAYDAIRAEEVAAIYSSDLLRAHEAATWLGVKLGLRPRIASTLRERAMGAWEGKTPAEACAAWPDLYPLVEADPLRRPPPGGESFAQLLARTVPVLTRIAALHPGATALVVTHGGILKGLLCRLLEVDLTERESLGLDNLVRVLFEVEGERWRVLVPERLARRQARRTLDLDGL